MNKNESYSIKDILKMDPMELTVWLMENFTCEIPVEINTTDELNHVANLLATLTNQYSYLMGVLAFLRILVKDEKRRSKTSKETEDMMLKRDAFQTAVDIVKQQYNAISRILTVKQEINREIFMH